MCAAPHTRSLLPCESTNKRRPLPPADGPAREQAEELDALMRAAAATLPASRGPTGSYHGMDGGMDSPGSSCPSSPSHSGAATPTTLSPTQSLMEGTHPYLDCSSLLFIMLVLPRHLCLRHTLPFFGTREMLLELLPASFLELGLS